MEHNVFSRPHLLRVPFQNVPYSKSFTIFPVQTEDSIVTLVIRNTTELRTKARYEVCPSTQDHVIDLNSTELELHGLEEVKKQNIFVPAGSQILIRTTYKGIEACTYLAVLTAHPGISNLQIGETVDVEVTIPTHLTKAYAIRYEVEGLGISVVQTSPTIDGTQPIIFKVTRGNQSSLSAFIHFYIDELKLRTTAEFTYYKADTLECGELSMLSVYVNARNAVDGGTSI